MSAPIYFRNVYAADLHGSEFQAVVELRTVAGQARPVLRACLNVRTGFGGSSRRADLDEPSDELILCATMALQGLMPREVFADALQEAGCDEGLTGTVRGYW